MTRKVRFAHLGVVHPHGPGYLESLLNMPEAEVVAQIWIHHQIAHAYEASARWPPSWPS